MCSHVHALLRMVNHFNMTNVKEIPWDKTCTDLPQKWHQPRGATISPEPLMKLSFAKALTDICKERKRPPVQCMLYEARASGSRNFKPEAVEDIKKYLCLKKKIPFSYLLNIENKDDTSSSKFGPMPIGSVLSYQLKDYKPKFCVTSTNLPLPLKHVQRGVEVSSLPCRLGKPAIDVQVILQNKEFKSVFEKIQVSMDQAKHLEEETKQQSLSSTWRKERLLRLTASNFGHIMKRKAIPSEAFLKRIFQHKDLSKVASVSHGIQSENKAKDIYRKKVNRKFQHQITVYDTGLIVNPAFPWLGASPDGKIQDCSSLPSTGLLEIKCPYTYRDSTPQEASVKPGFFCELIDENVCLKRDHFYYDQVQGQLAVSGLQWCDFVVFTNVGINIERINFNEEYWRQTLFPKLTEFYFNHGLPYLVKV